MTAKEKANFKVWNIETGKSKELADQRFKQLQDMCKEYGLIVSCCAESNVIQLLHTSIDIDLKARVNKIYKEYIEYSTKFETLLEVVHVLDYRSK